MTSSVAASHFTNGRQQVLADDRVMFRFDLQRDVLLRNELHCIGQRGRIVDVLGIGTDRPGQGPLLGAGLLVRRIEVRLHLRVLAKHARVEMTRQGLAVRLQGGDGLFNNGNGFRLEHACSPVCTI